MPDVSTSQMLGETIREIRELSVGGVRQDDSPRQIRRHLLTALRLAAPRLPLL